MVVDQEDLIQISSHMSYEEASTLLIAYGTAWNALYGNRATIMSGDTVLCVWTGGVSVFTAAVSQSMRTVINVDWYGRVVQIALTAGARVIMTSSSDAKLETVKKHLAKLITTPQAFQTINYGTHNQWDQEVDRLTNGEKVDFLVEIGGVKTLPTSIKSTKRGGLIAVTGILTNQKGARSEEGKFLKDSFARQDC
jgi:NADPH:quinone reductase-like Zn-dependent oxidoreductase